jgi:hypothetical protein
MSHAGRVLRSSMSRRLAALGAVTTLLATCLAGLGASSAVAAPAAAASTTPFYAVQRVHTRVPAGVMPWDPSWSPDGKHILFQDDNHGFEWYANANGTGVHCISCRMADHPKIIGGFTYAFPDNKRMLLANELGDSVYVLECAPTLFNCRSHRWLPVDLSGDETPGEPNLGRRTYHLAPDGVHLAYSITRPDGLVMMIAALQREPTEYKLVDYRVINPSGPRDALDPNPDGWANGGSLDEFKSFADGGRSAIILSDPSGLVPQQEKIDLATGKVTELTGYPDWNEDGALSPDDRSLLTESWRTEHRLTSLGLMPLARPFITLGAPIVAIYYVSSRPGFACDLQPWLLPAGGDRGGALVGQPLNPYDGGQTISGNDLEGQQVWSPDSTRVLLQGRSLRRPPAGANSYLLQKGPAPSDLIVAHILRSPTKPIRPVTTRVGSWAPAPQQYKSSFDMPGVHTVRGQRSGTAVIDLGGNVIGGRFSVTYKHYSDDGKHFLDGTQTIDGGVETSTTISDNLTATNAGGHQIGYLRANLTFSQIQPPPPAGDPGVTFTGTVSSAWMGKTASGLPEVGACPNTMPRPLHLQIHNTQAGRTLTIHITANSHGDIRPVQGATVKLLGHMIISDRRGLAVLKLPPAGEPRTTTVTASAGNTFKPASARMKLRRPPA